jgi:conjugal transfer pilus assembly protein TraW
MRRVDWGKVRDDLQRRVVERLHEGPNIGLQPATSSRVFTVDVTQRYEHDISNHDGTAVVVKGGTEINPLTRIALSHRYVVIDGRDAKQLTYAQSLIQRYGFGVKILLSAGDVSEVAKQLQRRVYWVQPEMVSKFQLAHVPSVISQNGPVLKIEEVAL